MNPHDIAGHFSYAWLAFGMYLLTKGNKWGWPARLVGEISWVFVGLSMGMSSIWMWGLLFVALDLRGLYKWWKWDGRFDH